MADFQAFGDNVLVDIDHSNVSTADVFKITHDNQATELFRVQENGNVGIGASGPAYPLVVSGDPGAIQISGATDQDKILWIDGKANTNSHYIRSIANSLKIQANEGSNQLLLNADGGNVGIGTTSPAEKLHVEGNIVLNSSSLSEPEVRIRNSGTDKFRMRYGWANPNLDYFDIDYYNGSQWVTRLQIDPAPYGSIHAATGDFEVDTNNFGFVCKSPNGTRYRITVNNSGTLIATAL